MMLWNRQTWRPLLRGGGFLYTSMNGSTIPRPTTQAAKEEMTEEEAVIVGAGIAGLATAVALKRVGVSSMVLEGAEELRTTGTAITLFPNAWLALDALGVSDKLISRYAPLTKGYVTNVDTEATQEFRLPAPNGNGGGTRSVHRRALLEALASELPSNAIRFSSKVASIDARAQKGSSLATIHLEDGSIIKTKVLIGCDGVHSAVARWLGLAEPVNSGRSAVRGLAVFPEGHGMSHEVFQFVNANIRAGFAPLNDKEVYWFMVTKSSYGGAELKGHPKEIQRAVMEKYAKGFPPLYLNVVRHSELSSLSWAPLMFRPPWNVLCGNLSSGGITVAGDAFHPMTPDLGHGGCSALEDAVVLGRMIGNPCVQSVDEALQMYIKERRWRASWLITGSYLSGWVQQSGYGWLQFLRVLFYKFIIPRLTNVVHYDCGKLPIPSSSRTLCNSTKRD